MSVGENIRRIRESKGIPQTQLADKIGFTQSMLCQIERGRKKISMEDGRELARILGCEMEDLFAEK